MEIAKSMLDAFYDQLSQFITENSQKAQEELQIGLANTRDELADVKRNVEDTKLTLESKVEQVTELLRKFQAGETKLEAVEDRQHPLKNVDFPTIETKNFEDERKLLLDSCKAYERSYAELRETHQNLLSEHQDTCADLAVARKQFAESERRQRSYKNQVERLQSHLAKNATNANELIDSDINQRLDIIRARTQSIVKRFCVGEAHKPERKSPEFAQLDDDWAKKERSIITKYNQEDVEEFRTYWMRGQIYMFLERDIFNQRVFGLEPDLEEKLAEFERLIAKHNPHTDTSDWRGLTVGYSKSIGMTNGELPKRVAQHVANLFHPWIVGNPSLLSRTINLPGSRKYEYPPELVPTLTELCQNAYDLAVMLRRSADNYYFLPIDEGTKVESQEGEDFQLEDMIGPKNKLVGSKVWITLFGALVKESHTGGRHVMAKARIVCKAPLPLPDRRRSVSPRKKE